MIEAERVFREDGDRVTETVELSEEAAGYLLGKMLHTDLTKRAAWEEYKDQADKVTIVREKTVGGKFDL